MMRYIPEASGAVLDTKTGLRQWFNSHADAISYAEDAESASEIAYLDQRSQDFHDWRNRD